MYFIATFESTNVKPLAAKTVVLSFYARKGADYSGGNLNLNIEFGTGTDTGALTSPTSAATTTTSFVLTTSWQKFSQSVSVASTATAARAFWDYVPSGTAGTNDYFEITGVQLEVGAVATPFESEDYSATLAKCQRYYWRGGNGSPGIFNGGSTARYSIVFPTTMRTAPTTTAIAAPIVINPTVAEQQTGSQTTGFSVTGFGESVNYSAAQIQLGGFSSGVDGRPTTLLNTALQFSAEL
jgi:hypothetical protein